MFHQKRFSFRLRVLAAAAASSLAPVALNAAIIGNPSVDSGWTALSGSSSTTRYIDGAGAYNFTMYTTAFTLDGASPLVGGTWQAGDVIVGAGGVFSGTNTDISYSGGADEHSVTHSGATSTRIVIKYGTSTATWTTPGAGALANGGVGAVLLGTYPYDFYPANNGQFVVPNDLPQEQTGVATTTSINGDLGRVITAWNLTDNTLTSFESYLDLTLLNSEDPSNGVALGNEFVIDLQRGTNAFQDSLGNLPSDAPEPASLGLIAIAGVGLLTRRRRSPARG